nr:ABC transporter permease [Candidatus Endomicrobium trichonymphae]
MAVGGTTLGVAALVVTLAVMSGFQNDIRNKILGIQPHIIVVRIDGEPFKDYLKIEYKIKTNSDVLSVSPFICKQGIVISLGLSTSLIVKAVDYKNENGMLDLSKQMTVLDMSFNGEKIGKKSIILGSELAKNIAVSVGNKVVLMFPSNFSSIPKMYEFTVSAVIQSGMYDFDYSLGFIDLEEGQKLFSVQNEITGFDIHINNFDKAVTAAALQKDLSYPYRVKTWIEMNKNLFSAL